jgi:hypothetical protein
MAEAWENDWAALDRQTRGRLRRAAFQGRAVSDPAEAALVAAFARTKATERRGAQLALHLLIIAGIIAALVLNVTRKDGNLAPVYGALLVVDLALLGFFVGTKGRLIRAAELNDRAR